MWVFTTSGFYSVVQDKNDREMVTIRARTRSHLEDLMRFSGIPSEILRTDDRDYLFRTIMPKTQWASTMSLLALDIDYTNFKDEVGRNRKHGKYHTALSKVWGIMVSLQWDLHKAGLYGGPWK
jgi:hypothetical protein